MNCMTGDACIAGEAYPVDTPGLDTSGVQVILVFLFSRIGNSKSYGFITFFAYPWVYSNSNWKLPNQNFKN